MRIVSGSHRGRVLVAPKGHSTRPTADRTRESVFNVLEHAPWSRGLIDVRVLDLFAGSGALGLEALSRGAGSCVSVDLDDEAAATIARNALALRLADRLFVRRADATRLGPNPAASGFDLAFLDPPYGAGMCEPALTGLTRHNWLEPGAIMVVERGAGEPAPMAPGCEKLDARDWGAARVHFLRFVSAAPE